MVDLSSKGADLQQTAEMTETIDLQKTFGQRDPRVVITTFSSRAARFLEYRDMLLAASTRDTALRTPRFDTPRTGKRWHGL